MDVGCSVTMDTEVMKRPSNAVSGVWDRSKILDFHFFGHSHVEGPRLKYCVNFYENRASQTSKIWDFLFFLPQTLPRALDSESLQNKLDQNPSVSRASFVWKKGFISRAPLGVSEKHL